ncbi:MAG: hypothetical protein ABSA51_04145 [Anaerolineaceae bacterium]|jgi:HEAT repeat protein
MNIQKSLGKWLKIKPNIENLKRKRDVDGLIEAYSYQWGNPHEDLFSKAKIAIILGDLGDSRGLPTVEKVLEDLNFREKFWKDTISTIGISHESTRDEYNEDVDIISFTRPHVVEALEKLRQLQHGNINATNKKKDKSVLDVHIESLIAVLKERNKSESERQAAEDALMEIGGAAVGQLLAALKDKNGDVDRVTEVLDKLGVEIRK